MQSHLQCPWASSRPPSTLLAPQGPPTAQPAVAARKRGTICRVRRESRPRLQHSIIILCSARDASCLAQRPRLPPHPVKERKSSGDSRGRSDTLPGFEEETCSQTFATCLSAQGRAETKGWSSVGDWQTFASPGPPNALHVIARLPGFGHAVWMCICQKLCGWAGGMLGVLGKSCPSTHLSRSARNWLPWRGAQTDTASSL